MYLERIYVSSFGKIRDYKLEFNSGLNTIKEDNGWGKTTLATFIKTMFYGIDNGRKGLSESERKKYKPWNSVEKFGGYVEFNWKGKSFRIERYFGSKESDDTVRLTDVATGKDFNKNLEDLGRRIFDIDEDGFKSTTYLGQKDFEIKSNTSITEKFNSLVGAESDDAFDDAVKKLESRSKTLKLSRGNGGLIYQTQLDIRETKENIETLKNSSNALTQLKEQVKDLQEKALKLSTEIESVSKKKDLASEIKAIKLKKDRYDECKLKIEKLKTESKKIHKILNGNDFSDLEIESLNEIIKDYDKNVQTISNLEKSIEQLKNVANNSSVQDKRRTNLLILPIFSALLFIGAVVTFITLDVLVPIILLVLSVVSISGFFLLKRIDKPKESNDNSLKGLIEKNLIEIEGYRSINQKYKSKLDDIFNSITVNGENYGEKLEELKTLVRERVGYDKDLEIQENLLKNYALDKDVFIEIPKTELDLDCLKEELDIKNSELSRLNLLLAEKKNAVVSLEDKVNNLSDLESKLSELEEKLEEYQKEYDIITKTLNCLLTAEENLKTRYKKPLEDSFRKYLSLISGNKADNANINVDMEVTLSEVGGAKETAYYSKGYRDMFDICKRFALIDVLFTGEKPFIILDDPFYNFDDKKVENAIAQIKALSSEYQIIYLVCHESRRA